MDKEPRLRPKQEKIETQDIEPKEANDILFWSFYYSQGNLGIQSEIYGYIAAKHPLWRISDGVAAALNEPEMKRKFENFYLGPAHALTREFYEEAPTNELKKMQKALNNPEDKLSSSDYLASILEGMLKRDMHYRDKGRERHRSIVEGPLRPRISHVLAYVIGDEQPPGPPIYKELMTDLKDFVNSPDLEKKINPLYYAQISEFLSRK